MMTREQLVGRTLTQKELEQVSGGGRPSVVGEGAYGTAYVASGGSSAASNDGIDRASTQSFPHLPGAPLVGAGKITAGQ
jgi:lactobin A/cerein 7B family class IIb bacteriocin